MSLCGKTTDRDCRRKSYATGKRVSQREYLIEVSLTSSSSLYLQGRREEWWIGGGDKERYITNRHPCRFNEEPVVQVPL